MSLHHGWAALHLQMPPRVPRTEGSAECHWELVRAVTGADVESRSDPAVRDRASQAFVKAWNYDLVRRTLIDGTEFGEYRRPDPNDDDSSVFRSVEEALDFDPVRCLPHEHSRDLVRRFDEDFRDRQGRFAETVATTGIAVSYVAGLVELFGRRTFLEAAKDDPERLGLAMTRYGDWIAPYFEALAESHAPVVMVRGAIVPLGDAATSSAWYRKFVFGAMRRLVKPLRDSGKIVLFSADGDYTEFVPDLVACGMNGFAMESATNLRKVAEEFGRTHVLIGNVDARALLRNDRAAIRAEVERCMAIGKPCPGFFLAVGNRLPPDAPVEAALYYNEVYEELSRR